VHPLRRARFGKGDLWQSVLMMTTVLRITAETIDLVEAFLRAEGGEPAVEGLMRSRARHDLLASDSFWLLLAQVDAQPAGLAAVARLPKVDGRAGYLFVDELSVLPAYRRQGVATALLQHTLALADEWGLAGVRLLVRPENEAARRLYQSLGFDESATLFCQRRV
jgi:ribosomal protein S18 acetylase RimI-like enzyme